MSKEYEYPIDALVDKYPWLNVYPETPRGWDDIITQMCEEINDYLVKFNLVDDYKVDQIKEKFGGLRWYDNGLIPHNISAKYEEMADRTCAVCGEKATRLTGGWIWPVCDECYKKYEESMYFSRVD